MEHLHPFRPALAYPSADRMLTVARLLWHQPRRSDTATVFNKHADKPKIRTCTYEAGSRRYRRESDGIVWAFQLKRASLDARIRPHNLFHNSIFSRILFSLYSHKTPIRCLAEGGWQSQKSFVVDRPPFARMTMIRPHLLRSHRGSSSVGIYGGILWPLDRRHPSDLPRMRVPEILYLLWSSVLVKTICPLSWLACRDSLRSQHPTFTWEPNFENKD